MIMRTLKDCLLILLYGFAVSTAVADGEAVADTETGSDGEARSSSSRVAQIIYFGAPSDAPEMAYVHQVVEEVQEVKLGRHNFSKSFNLATKANRLYFLPRALLEDEPMPENAPSVRVPRKWKKVLILVFEDKSNPILPIQLKAINASDDEFGPGELFFVNFSEMTVFGLVGDKKLVSKPSTTEIISTPREGRGTYMLRLHTFKDDVNKRRRLIQQKCQFDPSERVVTFMVPLPAPRMVKIYSAPVKDL